MQRNATDPTKLYDFGAPTNNQGNRTFLQNGMVATGNETKITGIQVGIWPNGKPCLGEVGEAFADQVQPT